MTTSATTQAVRTSSGSALIEADRRTALRLFEASYVEAKYFASEVTATFSRWRQAFIESFYAQEGDSPP